MPVCLEEAFSPNIAVEVWQPADGPNCDSTTFAEDP